MIENHGKNVQKHRAYYKTLLLILVIAILVLETLLYVSYLGMMGKSFRSSSSLWFTNARVKLIDNTRHLVNNPFLEIDWGGSYIPQGYVKESLAVIVPYRAGAEAQLKAFLNHLHPFLIKQNVQYTIFVIEFSNITVPFNRGALANIGVREAISPTYSRWSCLVLHSMALVPLDPRTPYSCARRPRVLATVVDGRELSPTEALGGVLLLTPRQYADINGFSNHFWRAGDENYDLAHRLTSKGYEVESLNTSIGRYARLEVSLSAKKQHQNLLSTERPDTPTRQPLTDPSSDGLSTLQHNTSSVAALRLHTRVIATAAAAAAADAIYPAGELSSYLAYLDYL